MRAAPIDTAYGRGWAAFEDDDAVFLVLPGGTSPATESAPPPGVAAMVERVEAWFRGEGRSEAHPALCERAGRTGFEVEVYRVVSDIAPGETMTYAEVAAVAGRPGAARAVGAAMARNPFAPLIPCHRVIGSDGRLRGYGGGLEMKRALIEEERG